jgi:hypothetical protein
MNKRLERVHKLAFKHHNDGQAIISPEQQDSFEALILIDIGMESLTPSGDIQGDEIHIQILHFGQISNGWQGALIQLVNTDIRFRCDRKVNDDGYVIRMSVTQLFDDDQEEIERIASPENDAINRSW